MTDQRRKKPAPPQEPNHIKAVEFAPDALTLDPELGCTPKELDILKYLDTAVIQRIIGKEKSLRKHVDAFPVFFMADFLNVIQAFSHGYIQVGPKYRDRWVFNADSRHTLPVTHNPYYTNREVDQPAKEFSAAAKNTIAESPDIGGVYALIRNFLPLLTSEQIKTIALRHTDGSEKDALEDPLYPLLSKVLNNPRSVQGILPQGVKAADIARFCAAATQRKGILLALKPSFMHGRKITVPAEERGIQTGYRAEVDVAEDQIDIEHVFGYEMLGEWEQGLYDHLEERYNASNIN